MANQKETSRKDDYIEFTLKVKAGRKKDWVEFGLDLNPNDRLISISESYSSFEELNKIFKHILTELDIINKRTRVYNAALDVNPKRKKNISKRDMNKTSNLSLEKLIGSFIDTIVPEYRA